MKKTAWNNQIGGNHYTKLAIQPMQYCMVNKLNALQSAIIGYVSRYNLKNGAVDLEKAKHCIDLLIVYEYNDKKMSSKNHKKLDKKIKKLTKK